MIQDALLNFRRQLDDIDNEILILIKRRFHIVKKIGKYKFENQMEIFNETRENEIYKKLINKSIRMDLSENLVKDIFYKLIEESKFIQQELIDKENSKKSKK